MKTEKIIECLEICRNRDVGCTACAYRDVPYCDLELRIDALDRMGQLRGQIDRLAEELGLKGE